MLEMRNSKWIRRLAYVTGAVNQELILRNEYLAAENRVLRSETGLRLSDPERGNACGKQYAERPVVSPEGAGLVVRMARETTSWGYDRIAGGLVNSVGSFGGFAGPYVVGYLDKTTNSFFGAMVCLSLSSLVAACFIVALRQGKRKIVCDLT